MKTMGSMIGILLVGLLTAVAEDGIRAIKIQGGLPPLDKDGKEMPMAKTALVDITGTNFTALLPDVKAVIPLIGGDTWWDVPPDASYVSIVIQMGEQTYTLNSVYPLFKDRATIAVTDIGLVAVSSRRDKEAREKQNDERYKALLHFFDVVLAGQPR